jgi:hypothetical protein
MMVIGGTDWVRLSGRKSRGILRFQAFRRLSKFSIARERAESDSLDDWTEYKIVYVSLCMAASWTGDGRC